jgi:RNA polymerase sigma-70 factor (ECF subfamily)
MQSDEELLAAWQGGDRTAGDRLVDRYFDPVCRFFRGKLGADVDDLIQRTFLDCVERRDEIRQPTFRSYLFAVARNRLLDHLRGQLRRPVDALPSRSIQDLRTLASGAIAREQSRDAVTRALQALPLDFQITLELSYWEQLPGIEIAGALGVSEHTVRSRLSRGRQMLRAEIERQAATTADATTTLQRLESRLAEPTNALKSNDK